MSVLQVLAVASEFYPLIKTGGLADVTGALPGALMEEGVKVTTLLPGYPPILAGLKQATTARSISDLFGTPARLLRGEAGGNTVLALDAPGLYARQGSPYGWPDDALRFGGLARVGAEIACGAIPGYAPDVVHVHDWQAGLLPAYLRALHEDPPPSVMTIHNLAFQGIFPPEMLLPLGLPYSAFTMEGVEFFGSIGFMKAGLQLANHVTTVSPSYAAEITTPESGMGLDGVLRARGTAFSGILNGIDTEVWNPATDTLIPRRFSVESPEHRATNKAALCDRFGLHPGKLLFGIVSRLTWQKGIDLLPDLIPAFSAIDANLALLGAGDAELEARISATGAPGQIGYEIGYDESLAHLIYAGADALLIPSRFEPCGLTQFCAMRYGCLPVVSRVGGLADTVIDANVAALEAGVATGFQFNPVSLDALRATLERVAAQWQDQASWRRMQINAMSGETGWARSAKRYAKLFRDLASGRR
jgi:starch synthase